MKKYSRFYNFCFLLTCTLFVLLLIGFAFLQTKAFQNYLTQIIIAEAKGRNIVLTIDNLKGTAPLKWSCDKATLSLEDGTEIVLKNAGIRAAFFPLFQKSLSLSFVKIDSAVISFPSPDRVTIPFAEVHLPELPFSVSAKTVQIKELSLIDRQNDRKLDFTLVGKAKIDKDLKEIGFDLILTEPLLNNLLHVRLISSEKKDVINAKVTLVIENSDNLAAFFALPLETALEGSIRCWGKWVYWQQLKQKKGDSDLSFAVRSKIDSLSIPSLPFLNGSWSLDTRISLYPDLSSRFDNLSVESNRLRLLGKASFSPSFIPTSGSALIGIENIEEFSSLFPIRVAGKTEIKTALNNNAFLFSISSPALTIGTETFSPAECKIQSTEKDGLQTGTITCSLHHSSLPWEGSSDFTIEQRNLHIQDIALQAKDMKISGSLDMSLNTSYCKGSFFLLIPELRPLRALFSESDFEGKLGGNFSFSYKNADLSLTTHLIAKNVRYQSSLLNSGVLDINAQNILTKPSGLFLLECENLLTRKGRISKLHLASAPAEEGKQSYALKAFGDWKEQFRLASSGLWTLSGSDLTITSSTAEGNLFNHSFKANPFTITKQKDLFSLQDLSLQVGEGSFAYSSTFTPSKADINLKASHLPLDVLTLFYPNISLYGYASCEGAFSGSIENTQGHLLVALEEGTLPQMQAKGSLQAHFNSKSAQVHAYFYGTNGQFIDSSATLPLRYRYEPFSIEVDKSSPLSGEWTSQGEIAAVFAFLQMPNQKTSGLLTSHLFLSGTPETPYLQGDLDIQGGLYENYFIGIKGKNINAKLTALGSYLHLDSLSAFDKKGGNLTATGKLLLNPSQNFPYTVNSDLRGFYFINSDFLTTQATGELILNGTKDSVKATGDLQIDSAVFTLSDRLPGEIPTLPITYVNKPIHLQQSEVMPSANYPINLDLNLTANDTVTIKGRGLDSTWQGKVNLTGTPEKLTGKGSLTLKKGEFTFSGKTFVLTKGEITFSDKGDQGAYLVLSGDLHLPAATIIANLQGPLTSPRLTFQSVPGLPISSILSLILFNKDISEISALQALQLAQVVMSLSGSGGPDVMGAIRKTIGVDKLNISGKEGSDEIALQIGWCVAKGITVSLSQSATGSDVTIEVDLKNGFLFEAETQNREEGKFSLKWNRNY